MYIQSRYNLTSIAIYSFPYLQSLPLAVVYLQLFMFPHPPTPRIPFTIHSRFSSPQVTSTLGPHAQVPPPPQVTSTLGPLLPGPPYTPCLFPQVPFISPMSKVFPSCSSRSARAAFFLCFLPS